MEFFPEAIGRGHRLPSNHDILKAKLTSVLKPGEWAMFNALLTHSLVRKTVQESKYTS